MKTNYYLALIAVVISSVAFGSCSKHEILPDPVSIESFVRQREDSLRHELAKCYSHIDQWNHADSVTQDLNRRALLVQQAIDSILQKLSPDGYWIAGSYQGERTAFSKWQSFQQSVSDDAILTIWDLYVGGTAGGDAMTRHCFEIACTNLADQEFLLDALSNKPFTVSDTATATVKQIAQAKDELMERLDKDSGAGILAMLSLDIADIAKAKDILDADCRLFSDWMEARFLLESRLKEPCKSVFSSGTNYWMHFYYTQLHERFISTPID